MSYAQFAWKDPLVYRSYHIKVEVIPNKYANHLLCVDHAPEQTIALDVYIAELRARLEM